MSTRGTDPSYLREQYGDSEKLRIRIETHQRYSQKPDDWPEWVLDHVDPRPGLTLVDVGCGPGAFHPGLVPRGVRIVGVDASAGMVAEAAQQARTHGLRASAVQADAQWLPLADRSCDRAIAFHMLYHVPDVARALREIRRVLRPGGRAVLTTNAADHGALFYQLHWETARDLGLTPLPRGTTAHFSLDHFPLVRSVFPTAQRFVRRDSFVFPAVEPALRYYATAWIDAVEAPPGDHGHRARLLDRLGQRIAAVIAAEGALRVPKDAGCFVADV